MNKPSEILLSEQEQKAVAIICNSFRMNYNNAGRKIKIKSAEVVKKLKERGHDLNDADLRNILAFIRRNHLLKPGFILSDNGGYWYSENLDEMKRVWESQYGRVREIMANFKPLHDMFTQDPRQGQMQF
jgi:hypothetical protein